MFANADGKFNDLVEKINAIDERRRFGPGISVGSRVDYGAFTGSNGGMSRQLLISPGSEQLLM